MTQRFIFLYTSSGSSQTLSKFNSNGYPRIYEGSGIYIYRLGKSLLKSDDVGVTFSEVGNGGTTLAICQDAGTPTKTLIFNSSTLEAQSGFYQTSPETAGGWSSTGSLPDSFTAVDAVADSANQVGILVGNSTSGASARVIKSAQTSPYSFASSSTGLTTAAITDLELVE